MSKKIRSVAVILSLILGLSAFTIGQEPSGHLEGSITDRQGAVVPNVRVTITNPNTGFKLTTMSDGIGFFRVSQLSPATYAVTTAASIGFSQLHLM